MLSKAGVSTVPSGDEPVGRQNPCVCAAEKLGDHVGIDLGRNHHHIP